MKFLHFRRPQPSCWYCGAASHADAPCPQRVRDAYRFAVTGAQIYPPRPEGARTKAAVICDLRLLEDLMLVVAADISSLRGPTPAARSAELAGAAATRRDCDAIYRRLLPRHQAAWDELSIPNIWLNADVQKLRERVARADAKAGKEGT